MKLETVIAVPVGLFLLAIVVAGQKRQEVPKHHGKHIEHLSHDYVLDFTLALPLRNETELDKFLQDLQNPNSADFKAYLQPDEFCARFCPSEQDVLVVKQFLDKHRLHVVSVEPTNTLVHARGFVKHINAAFDATLNTFQSVIDDTQFIGPSESEGYLLPSGVTGVFGLDSRNIFIHASSGDIKLRNTRRRMRSSRERSLDIQQGLGPHDIKQIYNIPWSSQGKGQSIALVQFDLFSKSDVQAYVNNFNLSIPKLPIKLVTIPQACMLCCQGKQILGHCAGKLYACSCVNVPNKPGDGQNEVALDIELVLGMAPQLAALYVYTAPNSLVGSLKLYSKIASDNKVKVVSTSWGASELTWGRTAIQSHAAVFKQMVAQGMTIVAASGDNGAFDPNGTLSVNHPASQPLVTAVGGTSLTVNATTGQYMSETTWWDPYSGYGSGGGVSTFFQIPPFQQNNPIMNPESMMSTTFRNVPDVALMADRWNYGYSMYVQGSWIVVGGTSAAAPIWAAFIALVNEQRAKINKKPLGLANTPLYKIAQDPFKYTSCYHDIADNSTNGFYPAVVGYDLATGLGSLNGVDLMAALTAS